VTRALALLEAADVPNPVRRKLPARVRRRGVEVAVGVALVFGAGVAAANNGAVDQLWRDARATVSRVVFGDGAPNRSAAPAPSGVRVEAPLPTEAPAATAAASEPVATSAPSAVQVADARDESADGGLGPSSNPVRGRGASAAEGRVKLEAPRESPAELFERAGVARRAGAPEALGLYERLLREHPGSAEAGLARAIVARLRLDRGDLTEALRGFDSYLGQGGGALGEEALAGRAMTLGRMGKTAEESQAWSELLARFPRSSDAAKARRRLADIASEASARPKPAGAEHDPL
jgi:TolA-binding protein